MGFGSAASIARSSPRSARYDNPVRWLTSCNAACRRSSSDSRASIRAASRSRSRFHAGTCTPVRVCSASTWERIEPMTACRSRLTSVIMTKRSVRRSLSNRFLTTSRAACFWQMTRSDLPVPMASATMLTMVWLFPVPGGPSMTSPGARRASMTAASCEGSLSAVK